MEEPVPGTGRKTKSRTFEVLVSFSGLNRGDRFSQDADDLGWATQHVETGYLRDVTEEITDAERSEVGQG
jgi:hypothetical protein